MLTARTACLAGCESMHDKCRRGGRGEVPRRLTADAWNDGHPAAVAATSLLIVSSHFEGSWSGRVGDLSVEE